MSFVSARSVRSTPRAARWPMSPATWYPQGSLRGWVRQAEADAGERDDLLTAAERDELKELRKENAELRRANEILKAASVFFAQEIDRPRTRPSR